MPEERLGRYRLLSLLATGGMGEVFLARQEGPAGFSKLVVVKRILRHLAQDQGFIDLFLNEARLAAQLQHPHIAQVFGLEHEGGSWFIAMEHVHGKSLRAILDQTRSLRLPGLPEPVALRLLSQALQGLHFAHELTDDRGQPLGILHRDVTPENVLVSFSGVAKLVDFGIAKAMSGAETRVGRPKGKLAYMAPELVRPGATIDRRADVYGVGVVLYEALTLKRPANAPETLEALEGERGGFVPDPGLAADINAVIAKALEPKPEDRFPTALAMSEAIEAVLSARGVSLLPSDVTAHLSELFGQETVTSNPSRVPVIGIERTDVMSVHVGTQPVQLAGRPPATRTEDELRAVRAPPPAGLPTNQRWLLFGVAFAVALVFGGIALLGISGPPKDVSVPDAALSVVDAGAIEEMLDFSLPERDAGLVEVAVVDAGAKVVDKSSPKHPVRTGHVTVRVNPWAEVFFNGKSYGVTPIAAIEVPAGYAAFTLKNRQLGVMRGAVVKVPAGGNVVLKVDLFSSGKGTKK